MKKLFFILCVLLLSVGIMAQSSVFYTDVFTIEQGDTIFMTAEIPPQFPGGRAELMRFIIQNFRFPESYTDLSPAGMIVCQFIVEKDGTITQVEVIRGQSQQLNAQVIKLIESMPKWTPGRQDGRPVRMRYTLPIRIRFSVE